MACAAVLFTASGWVSATAHAVPAEGERVAIPDGDARRPRLLFDVPAAFKPVKNDLTAGMSRGIYLAQTPLPNTSSLCTTQISMDGAYALRPSRDVAAAGGVLRFPTLDGRRTRIHFAQRGRVAAAGQWYRTPARRGNAVTAPIAGGFGGSSSRYFHGVVVTATSRLLPARTPRALASFTAASGVRTASGARPDAESARRCDALIGPGLGSLIRRAMRKMRLKAPAAPTIPWPKPRPFEPALRVPELTREATGGHSSCKPRSKSNQPS